MYMWDSSCMCDDVVMVCYVVTLAGHTNRRDDDTNHISVCIHYVLQIIVHHSNCTVT